MTSLFRKPSIRGERDGEQMYRDVWLPISGAERVPVDPYKLCRRLGVDAFAAELGHDVGGAIVKDVGFDPVIIVNNRDLPVRQRFTVAHELGHYWLRKDEIGHSFEWTENRDFMAFSGKHPDEIYCNNFAAALLMPAAEVREAAARHMDSRVLAVRFEVSLEAMTFRLKNLGLS